MKMGTEAMKKTQTEVILEMKILRWQTGTAEASLTNRKRDGRENHRH